MTAYHERWEIEIAIDERDIYHRLVNHPLRSNKPVGGIQAIYALLIAPFVLRRLMHQAALQEGIDPDRLSFLHPIPLVQAAIPEVQRRMQNTFPSWWLG